jgi:hypothetical protein
LGEISASLVLLERIRLEEVKTLLSFIITRFSLPLLVPCHLLRLQLPFACIDFFKKEKHRILPTETFVLSTSLLLPFKIFSCSEMSYVAVVHVTRVTSNVGRSFNTILIESEALLDIYLSSNEPKKQKLSEMNILGTTQFLILSMSLQV